MIRICHLALTVLIFAGGVSARSSDCQGSPSNGEIERTVHAFFDSLRKEDKTAFKRLTTETFYAFDGGERYAGTALVDVVRDAHAKGVELVWSIGPLDTKFRCDVAWSAWENTGSSGVPPAIKPVRWLESAVLIRQNGRWKIDFFHSQRAISK